MKHSLSPIKNGFVLISEEDLHLLDMGWTVVKPDGVKPYATRSEGRKTLYLHREILGATSGQEVDHINGDGLDNRRENLRIATRSQNCANRKAGYAPKSGFRGVYAQPHGSTWQAKITVNGKVVRAGNFSSREEAAQAYDALAKDHFGEFAVLNFPQGEK